MEYLHCLSPSVEPRVSDHIPQILDMIKQVLRLVRSLIFIVFVSGKNFFFSFFFWECISILKLDITKLLAFMQCPFGCINCQIYKLVYSNFANCKVFRFNKYVQCDFFLTKFIDDCKLCNFDCLYVVIFSVLAFNFFLFFSFKKHLLQFCRIFYQFIYATKCK